MQSNVNVSVFPNGETQFQVGQMVENFTAVYDLADIRQSLADMLIIYLMFYVQTSQLLSPAYADRIHANYIVLDKLLADLQTAKTPSKELF